MANRSRITFGIKLRGRLKEKSFGIYELRDIILHVHYCNYSLQGGTKVKVQSNAVNCYIRLNRYFCSTLYLRTLFSPILPYYYSLLYRGNCWSCRYWGPLRSVGGLQWFWTRCWHYQYWIHSQTISQAIFLLKQKSPSWSQISGRRCCCGKGSK